MERKYRYIRLQDRRLIEKWYADEEIPEQSGFMVDFRGMTDRKETFKPWISL